MRPRKPVETIDEAAAMDQAKNVMSALVRTPPKPHEEMKIGKPREKKPKSPRRKKKSAT